MTSDPVERYLRVPRERIAFITKTIEAMGHIAVVSTVDRSQGLLRIMCDRSAEKHMESMLESIGCPIVNR